MSDGLTNITEQNFEKTVIKSPVPVMLILWSEEYEGCKRLYRTIRELALQYQKSMLFGLIDVDNQPGLSRQLCIGGLPCIMILRDGRLCANIGGELPLSHYKCLIDKMLKQTGDMGDGKEMLIIGDIILFSH